MQFDYNAEPIGRQPDHITITPSAPNPWYGTITGGKSNGCAIVGGEPLTAQQRYVLTQAGKDPAAVELITVKRKATMRELYWGSLEQTPIFAFSCPVVFRRQDGQVKVITPAGDGKFVTADGWAGRSKLRSHGGH